VSGWRTIKPECRHCGIEVEYFGRICEDCLEFEGEERQAQAVAEHEAWLMTEGADQIVRRELEGQ